MNLSDLSLPAKEFRDYLEIGCKSVSEQLRGEPMESFMPQGMIVAKEITAKSLDEWQKTPVQHIVTVIDAPFNDSKDKTKAMEMLAKMTVAKWSDIGKQQESPLLAHYFCKVTLLMKERMHG